MGTINFILLALAVLSCLACVVFLIRGYAATGVRLLLCGGVCVAFLILNNLLVFLDFVVFPDIDIRPYRQAAAVVDRRPPGNGS
jgi:hypothetical protein